MPRITETDLTEIYGDTSITDTVTIAGNSVQGHFFAPHADALGMGGTRPTFRCSAADASAAGGVVDAVLVSGGVNYVITSVQPEKAGDVTLELRAQ